MFIPSNDLYHAVMHYNDIYNSGTPITYCDYLYMDTPEMSATINYREYSSELSGVTTGNIPQDAYSRPNYAVPLRSTKWFNPPVELGYIGMRDEILTRNEVGTFYGELYNNITVQTTDHEYSIAINNIVPELSAYTEGLIASTEKHGEIFEELQGDGPWYFDDVQSYTFDDITAIDTSELFSTDGEDVLSVIYGNSSHSFNGVIASSVGSNMGVYLRAKSQRPFTHLYDAASSITMTENNEGHNISISGLITDTVSFLTQKFEGTNSPDEFDMSKSYANDNLVADILLSNTVYVSAAGPTIEIIIGGEALPGSNIENHYGEWGIAVTLILSSATRFEYLMHNEEDIVGQQAEPEDDGAGNMVWSRRFNIGRKFTEVDDGTVLIFNFGTISIGSSNSSLYEVNISSTPYIIQRDFQESVMISGNASAIIHWQNISTAKTVVIEIVQHY